MQSKAVPMLVVDFFRTPALLFAVGFLSGIGGMAAEAATPMIEAEGTAFKVTLEGGRVLRSPDLVGATLGVLIHGRVVRLRIDDVRIDASDRRMNARPADAVWLHDFSIRSADGAWFNPCLAEPDGRAQGFVLAGRSDPGGSLHEAERGTFEIVCTSGAQAKCVRMGYRPWGQAPDGSSLRDAYNACVRMLRGDYAGADRPKTRDGVLIDIYDRFGIMTPAADDGMAFEAGWAPEGAVCVHHPRVRANTTLAELESNIPRLRGRTGAVCTEAFARAHGAVIFNRSKL